MRLAIIIPTIGRPILHDVLNSLLPQVQKHPSSKIYISYDGKKSSKKFKSLKQKIPKSSQIRLLSTGKNRSGASNARNVALKKAIPSSDLIAFLGDDTISQKDWLSKTLDWHTKNPAENKAILGRVHWVESLQKDRLHKWLDSHIQFDFHRLDQGYKPDWRHFTTSNLSLKTRMLRRNIFNKCFKGWGFEDGELGYRLYKYHNLDISYVPSIKVFHDHPQEFQKVLKNLKNARKNAKIFENIHPEKKLLPHGVKKLLLTILAFGLFIVPKTLSSKAYWWSRTKLVWLGYTFPIQVD